MNLPPPATLLIVAGIVLILAGLLYATGALGWFGHLPGDIRIEKETTRIYIPIVSCVVISILLSLLMWILGRLRG